MPGSLIEFRSPGIPAPGIPGTPPPERCPPPTPGMSEIPSCMPPMSRTAARSRAALAASMPPVLPSGEFPIGVLPSGVFPTGVFPIGLLPMGVVPMGLVPIGVMAMGLVPIGVPAIGLTGVTAGVGPATGFTVVVTVGVTAGLTVGVMAGVTGFGIAMGAFSAASTPVPNRHTSTQIELNAAFFMSSPFGWRRRETPRWSLSAVVFGYAIRISNKDTKIA